MNRTCRIDSLSSFYDFRATVDVLRLDLMHPIVSGNKWFKLKHYLAEAVAEGKTILTFGGAYSNHVVATAAAAHDAGLKSIAVIRGEEPAKWSNTLEMAASFGMKLCFTSREAYRKKEIPPAVYTNVDLGSLYVIPEGGYGTKGAAGAKDILLLNDTGSYTHIISAVGTGTTLAGLIAASGEDQKVIGISVLKNNTSLRTAIEALLPANTSGQWELSHDYHFGGYAKYNRELLLFMNTFYQATNGPTDFVYTAKAFYAAFDLLKQNYFGVADKILLVNTGGLQGNNSLPNGALIFG